MTRAEAEKLVDAVEAQAQLDARTGRSLTDRHPHREAAREAIVSALALPPETEGERERMRWALDHARGALSAALSRVGMPIDHDTRPMWRSHILAAIDAIDRALVPPAPEPASTATTDRPCARCGCQPGTHPLAPSATWESGRGRRSGCAAWIAPHDPACRCITHGGTRCTCPPAPAENAAGDPGVEPSRHWPTATTVLPGTDATCPECGLASTDVAGTKCDACRMGE